MSKKKVTLAYPYVGEGDKQHRADTTVELDAAEANRLIFEGRAREAAETEKKG